MSNRFSIVLLLACLNVWCACAQTPAAQTKAAPPQRSVQGQELTSTALPAVRLSFDPAFKYIGTQEFILYDVARAEQHFFVDADKDKRIRRLYWVQFEGYLPENTHTYNYRSTQKVRLGGLEFIADAYARKLQTGGRPDSDGARAQAFLKDKGYRMASDELMMQRLVHLTDEARRNELMVIYMEDLTPLQLTAADLTKDGKAAAQWDSIAKALLERAVTGMRVMPSESGVARDTTPEANDADAALAVVNQLFAAMRAKDSAAMQSLFITEGQFVATDRRNGQPARRVFNGESFAKLIVGTKGLLLERMYKPEVRVNGDLALVWGRYGFYVDERFSHCGLNSFQLLRTAEGWKIVHGASTIELDGCEPESKEKG